MKNLKKIDEFLPNPTYQGAELSDLIPLEKINEDAREGINLDGKRLSEPDVSDWLWDFNIKTKDFPKSTYSSHSLDTSKKTRNYEELLNPEEKLSIFSAQIINTFIVESWTLIKSGKCFVNATSENERERIEKKLKGFWIKKKNLDKYKQEKQTLIDYVKTLDDFISSGNFGVSIQTESDDIFLSEVGDMNAGKFKMMWTSVKAFFTKSNWSKALFWLISNIATNNSSVRWLTHSSSYDGSLYTPNRIDNGISPDIKSAFESFILYAGLQAEVPSISTAKSALDFATKKTIGWSTKFRDNDVNKEQWYGVLMNTDLFGVFQKLLIIGTCAWVYDMIGETNILGMTKKDKEELFKKPDDKTISKTERDVEEEDGVTKGTFNEVSVYYIPYTSKIFVDILDVLLSNGQIGKNRYDDYISQIESKGESRSLVRRVCKEIKEWGLSNNWTRTKKPDVKALFAEGTKLIVPVSMFNSMMESK